jgi:hypothetical protein
LGGTLPLRAADEGRHVEEALWMPDKKTTGGKKSGGKKSSGSKSK